MTDSEQHLRDLIAREGPIQIARYMQLCLTHPRYGYYQTRDPLGAQGDFITAPEISQMFGELIGLWVIDIWRRLDRPDPFLLVELGPGRGTLMEDLLRALTVEPRASEAVRVHFIETSSPLAARQAETIRATWHETLKSLPSGPAIFIANEFFDALPVHQFILNRDGWREIAVDYRAGKLKREFVEPGAELELISEELRAKASVGKMVEVAPAAIDYCRALGRKIKSDRGAGLIIDYGYEKEGFGDTLQGVKKHHYADVMDQPGEADLTAHVNFQALCRAFSDAGACPWGPTTQRAFLRRMGIDLRAAKLLEAATEKQGEEILAALHRLTGEDEMGIHFLVMAATASDQILPAGFE